MTQAQPAALGIGQKFLQHLALGDTRICRPAESVDSAGRKEGVEVAFTCLTLIVSLLMKFGGFEGDEVEDDGDGPLRGSDGFDKCGSIR